MVTSVYGRGGTRSMHGGKDENEQGYGTKMIRGTHDVYHRSKGYTKGRNEDGKVFNHRYCKQFRGRYMGRMVTQMMKILRKKRRERQKPKV